jgi:polar amino acid transport system substrate-binding protein
MKKFLSALLLVIMFAGISSATVIGNLSESNLSGENFKKELNYHGIILAGVLAEGFKDLTPKFYDSLSLMQLALHKGEIDAIACPELIGEYMLRHSSEYNLRGYAILRKQTNLAFGFLEEKSALRDRFSEAITAMLNDGTLGLIVKDYLTGPNSDNPPAVKLDHFDDAETINVAITGDMPPIDYVAEDGTPAGYNTAFLAELGRRLHININLISIDTGTRAAALKSGRADVVFWFKVYGDGRVLDIPEGVILSVPYYGWNKALLIGRK